MLLRHIEVVPTFCFLSLTALGVVALFFPKEIGVFMAAAVALIFLFFGSVGVLVAARIRNERRSAK